MSRIRLVWAVPVLVALLGACSDGGGGGDGGIPSTITLISEQDVIREVANLSMLHGSDQALSADAGATAAGARGMASSAGVRRLLASSSVADRQGVRAKRMSPQAETYNCDSGSTTSDSFFAVTRNLPLFDVSPTMDYYTDVDNNCRYVDGAETWTSNGRSEYGDNDSYSAATAESPNYYYVLDGSGSTPYTFFYQDTDFDEKVTVKSLGRSEYRENGTNSEARETIAFDLAYDSGGDGFDLEVAAGKSGDPLIYVDNYGDGTFSVDGPFGYRSTDCRGGNVVYDTVDLMTLGSDEYGLFISGGELVITSGNNAVTLVFQSDGGYQYQFSNGNSGEVTRQESLSGGDCLYF
jgi:hypothetical protein